MQQSDTTWKRGPVEPFLGDLKVHTYTFSNGLTLKVVPEHSAPVVAYQTWFGVGSADEVAGKTGLAHLFEHLMFKRTDEYGDEEYSVRLDALGADGLNAWTWLDQTVYVQSVPREAVEAVAEMEQARMDGIVLDEEAFRSELSVVINERKMAVDDEPDGKLSELLFQTAFARHPYGWPTIGWMKDLEAMQRPDAEGFYRRYYAPDNATILLVGDVRPDDAAELVRRRYGHMPPSGVDRPRRAPEPEQSEQRRAEIRLPISADRVLVGFKVPSYTHEDMPALLVLDAALTSGRTGRLQRALRDRGIVAQVGAMVMPLRDPSLYEIALHGRPGVPAEVAEQALFEELLRVREEGVSEGELAMGKAQWRAHTWASLETAAGKADFLGWALTHTGSHLDGLRRIEAIAEVTPEDVLRVAKRYLRPERSTVVTGRAEEPAPAVAIEGKGAVVPAARVPLEARPRTGPPQLPRGELRTREVEGASVLLSWDDTLPLVHFRLHLPMGGASEPADRPGLAHLAGQMLLRGTEERSREDFEAALEQIGATLGVGVDADGILLSGVSLSDHWPAFLTLVEEALTRPAFRDEDLQDLVLEVDNALAAVRDEDDDLAELALRQALYGREHPYGRDVRGTRESIRGIGVDALRSFHQDQVRSNGAVIGIAGGFDAGTDDQVRALLGRIAGAPVRPPRFPAVPAIASRRLVLVDKPERTQAQVRIGQTGLDHHAPSFPSFLLTNDAFGLGFSGRLMKEVRVKRGWSYFAYSYPLLQERGTAWQIALAPGSEQAVDAVELVVGMVEKARHEGLTSEEVEQARSARLKGRPFLVDTTRKRLDQELRKRTTGYDRLAATDQMASISLHDANRAFAEAIRPQQQVVVLVGTAADLKDALEARVGPVEVVDWRQV